MATNKMALGRGLGSLFPSSNLNPAAAQAPLAGEVPGGSPAAGSGAVAAGAPTASAALPPAGMASKDRHPGISLANVEEIIANPYQPRRDFDDSALEELAQSIRSNGIIQPLVVRRTPSGYELIAGERRLRASKLAGLTQVPIVIRKSTDRESLEIALIENIQRQDLNCVDEALAYFQLMQDFSLNQEEMAQKVGKDRATVANYLRLLRLPQIILEDLKSQVLSFGHGKALLGVEDGDQRIALYKEVVSEKLSVRETERRAELTKNPGLAGAKTQTEKSPASKKSAVADRMNQLSQELTRTWSTRVDIRGSEKKGKIVLHYSTRQDLDRILGAMQNERQWQASST